jgi:peptidoglycan hydrolase-like protein with peptidoglycan-binding domain
MQRAIAILLASAALAAPAFAASNAPNSAPRQPQQQLQAQPQSSQARQNSQAQNGQQASNEALAPGSLTRSQIRQVQTALDKDGFKAGRADGMWGPRTRHALQSFQKSKGMQGSGQLDNSTLAALGLNFGAQQQNHG